MRGSPYAGSANRGDPPAVRAIVFAFCMAVSFVGGKIVFARLDPAGRIAAPLPYQLPPPIPPAVEFDPPGNSPTRAAPEPPLPPNPGDV